jgi:hypothetical protein
VASDAGGGFTAYDEMKCFTFDVLVNQVGFFVLFVLNAPPASPTPVRPWVSNLYMARAPAARRRLPVDPGAQKVFLSGGSRA